MGTATMRFSSSLMLSNSGFSSISSYTPSDDRAYICAVRCAHPIGPAPPSIAGSDSANPKIAPPQNSSDFIFSYCSVVLSDVINSRTPLSIASTIPSSLSVVAAICENGLRNLSPP